MNRIGKNNPMYGRKHTQKAKKLMSNISIGDKNGMWRGGLVGYASLHEYVRNHLPVPDKCSLCGAEGKLDLHNKNCSYERDFSGWEYLCRRCHMKKDGRFNNLKQNQKKES